MLMNKMIFLGLKAPNSSIVPKLSIILMILGFLNILTYNVTAQASNSTQLTSDEVTKLLIAATNATANASAESMDRADNVLRLVSEAPANATESALSEARNLLSNASSAAITSSFTNYNYLESNIISDTFVSNFIQESSYCQLPLFSSGE